MGMIIFDERPNGSRLAVSNSHGAWAQVCTGGGLALMSVIATDTADAWIDMGIPAQPKLRIRSAFIPLYPTEAARLHAELGIRMDPETPA